MSTNSKLSFVFVVFLSSSFVFHSVFVFVFILYHSILSSSFCLCPSNIYIYLSLFLTSTTPPPFHPNPIFTRIVVFSTKTVQNREEIFLDIKRLDPAKLSSSPQDFRVEDTIINWKLSLKDHLHITKSGKLRHAFLFQTHNSKRGCFFFVRPLARKNRVDKWETHISTPTHPSSTDSRVFGLVYLFITPLKILNEIVFTRPPPFLPKKEKHSSHSTSILLFSSSHHSILGAYQILLFIAVNLARELAAVPTNEDATTPLRDEDLLRLMKTWCCGITR